MPPHVYHIRPIILNYHDGEPRVVISLTVIGHNLVSIKVITENENFPLCDCVIII